MSLIEFMQNPRVQGKIPANWVQDPFKAGVLLVSGFLTGWKTFSLSADFLTSVNIIDVNSVEIKIQFEVLLDILYVG